VAAQTSPPEPAGEARALPDFTTPLVRPEPGPAGDEAPAGPDTAAEVDDDPGAPYLLDEERFPLLVGLTRNLSAEAARGLIDPVIGRDRVIDTIIDVLNKRRSNNPCLVGEPGVGKTAIVEGLAVAIEAHGERLAALRDRVILSLDVGSLVAGTELRGSFSRRMAKLKDEVREADGRVIIFIDELHTLVGAGSGEGPLDAANDLKAALARGEFPCIGATTPREYHRHIEKDPALERRFQPVEVEEPSEEEALLILKGVIDKYEDHHGVLYQPEAVEAAVRLSRRYLVDRRLPDKAFNLVDTAAARAVRHGKEVVEIEDIAAVVGELTQIPVERLLMTDAERMLSLRDFLGARIIGHDEVLDQVTEVIQRNSAGFSSRRPIGSFLFLGPSGVGKTETAKVLAEFLFCAKDAMTRFDMSEFMERHAVSRLLGAAPGYVGHEEAGQLTAALTRRPYQIILFDEIEKAHADVLNVLLQVLDEGHITDAKGRSLSLSNTVIIMTTNLGATVLNDKSKRRIGFGGAPAPASGPGRLDPGDLDAVLREARRAIPPELWGRIDEKCVFAPLGEGEIARITRLLIDESSQRLLEERRISYEAGDDVIAHLMAHGGHDPSLGARPMRRAVQRICETAIARAVLKGDAQPGDHLSLQMDGDQLIVVPTVA
jgi:ATP-dependent Clp protease ATP-binding subunit ClpC